MGCRDQRPAYKNWDRTKKWMSLTEAQGRVAARRRSQGIEKEEPRRTGNESPARTSKKGRRIPGR